MAESKPTLRADSFTLTTPIGPLSATLDQSYVYALEFGTAGTEGQPPELYYRLKKNLDNYFRGIQREFRIPFLLQGTDFERSVYQACLEIPYGKTVSYSELAVKAGSPGAARAAGNALRKNPLPIIIPCHRIVSKNGIGGYAYGTEIKKKLLRYEGVKDFG